MSKIDFITVNWKTPDMVRVTYESIKKFVNLPFTFWGVNNGEQDDFNQLCDQFEGDKNVKVIKGVYQLNDSSIPGLKKDIGNPWIHTKYDRRKVHLASYALAEGLKKGLLSGSSEYVSFIQTDVVFLNEWTDDVLPMLEHNVFVSYAWRHDIDQANLPQWSIMKREIFQNNFFREDGDLYPNIHYKDTFGLFSLWVRDTNQNYHICENSLNDKSLKDKHILDLPHGEQGWINSKPFIYHYGRGTTRGEGLRKLWIETVENYLEDSDG